MDKKDVVHIHDGILLSHQKNALESVLMRWMKLEPIIQSEVSQKESESEVAQSCLTLCDPMDSSLHQAPLSMGFSRQEYWNGYRVK